MSGVHFLFYFDCLLVVCRKVWEGVICLVGTMESGEASTEDRVEEHEAERSEIGEERKFKVGELVEYWESKQDNWRSSCKTCRKTCVEPKRKKRSRRGQSSVAKIGWIACGNTGMVERKNTQTI